MKYLNLTEGFNPYNVPEEDCIKFKSFIFNGGEPHIKIDINSICNEEGDIQENCFITTRITSMDDLMMLMVAYEALDQSGRCKDYIGLFIPYFPGGRQDRRMIEGEPLSVKVFANMINSLECNPVITYDDHSDVTNALLENTYNNNNHDFVSMCLDDINFENGYIISPDSGSNKKSLKLIQSLGSFDNIDLVKCDKTREIPNGSLTGFEVYTDDLKGKDCIIVDDICDGGGTFIGLAKELKAKGAGDIYLIVSHGIFSKPLKELEPYFKKIYTTDSWRSEFGWEQIERDATDLVEIVKFKDFK